MRVSSSPVLCKWLCNTTSTRTRTIYVVPQRLPYAADSAPQVLARSAAALLADYCLRRPILRPTKCWSGPRSKGPVAPPHQSRAWPLFASARLVLAPSPTLQCSACSALLGNMRLLRRGLAVGSMPVLAANRRVPLWRWAGNIVWVAA